MSEHHLPDAAFDTPASAGAFAAPEPYISRIDRRTTLAWFGAVGFAVPAAARAQALDGRPDVRPVAAAKPVPGYGTDPVLITPKPAPWPRLMTAAQLQTTALLCDFILPASATAPSANALHVPDFIDEWVSAPYPQQIADRAVILDGLDAMETDSHRRFGKSTFESAPADRQTLFSGLPVRPSEKAAPEHGPHTFFRKFRSLVIGAYYTTDAGFKDIGYIGNVVLSSFPGPSPEVKAELDKRLAKLGL